MIIRQKKASSKLRGLILETDEGVVFQPEDATDVVTVSLTSLTTSEVSDVVHSVAVNNYEDFPWSW